MRVLIFILLGALSPTIFAGGYDLPTDLVIESDCDIDTTPPETVAINLPDAL